MIQFFKDSVRELKHVVWPTRAETKKYFLTVLTVLVCFGLYLFIASTIFSEILFGIKGAISGWNSNSVTPIFDPSSIVVQSWALDVNGSGTIVESWSTAE